jgi:hypothetical protein
MSTKSQTAEEFVNAACSNFGNALIPIRLAAAVLNVSRTRIEQLARAGKFDCVSVNDGKESPIKGITIQSFCEYKASQVSRDADDERLAKEIYNYLWAWAGDKDNKNLHATIPYAELMNHFGMSVKNPPHRNRIAVLLDMVSSRSHKEHGMFLSALVVRGSSGMPGPGFFDMWAKVMDEAKPNSSNACRRIWEEELAKLYVVA